MYNKYQYSFIDFRHPRLSEIIGPSLGEATPYKIDLTLRQYEDPSHFLVGCFLENKLMGIIGFETKIDHVLIKHIAVYPKFQKQGIGMALIQWIKKYYPEFSLKTETDQEAVQFYQKNEFDCTAFQGKYNQRYKCYFKR